MDHEKKNGMAAALRLTREGRLTEAVAVLRRILGGSAGDTKADDARTRPAQTGAQATSPSAGVAPGLGVRPRGPRPKTITAPSERVLRLSHTEAAGTRRFDLYVPTGWTSKRRALLVMLHGGSQHAADFAAGTRMNELAERHDLLVAYPEQSAKANNGGYWN
jgi:hypothetical protein